MDAFLSQARQEGQVSDVGLKFTVSGEKARERFLSSVPPCENTLFRGLMFLADALLSLGATPPKMIYTWEDSVSYRDFHRVDPLQPDLDRLGLEWFKERFNRPFTNSDRLAQDWDRAWLRILSAGHRIGLQVRRSREDQGWGFTMDLDGGFRAFHSKEFEPLAVFASALPRSALYMAKARPTPVRGGRRFDARGLFETRLRFGRSHVAEITSNRGLYDIYPGSELLTNWFQYRCRYLCLYERVVLDDSSPRGMVVSSGEGVQGEHLGEGLWLIEGPKPWARMLFGTDRQFFARRWVGPPERWTGTQRAQAYFTVALHDGPAQVDLYDHHHSLETVMVPNGPPGLLGIVHWPDLKPDLWGTKYVRDEAWDQAMAYLDEQMNEVFSDLERLSGPLLAELVGGRTKRAYRRDVEKKVNELWLSRPSFLQDGAPADAPVSIEQRADEIRKRLGM